MMKLMSIDPGLQGTGYAIWDGSTRKPFHPRVCGVITAPAGPDWLKRVDQIAIQILDECRTYGVTSIICEMMEMYQTASSAMAWSKGDLQRTMMLIGTIHGLTRKRCPTFILVPPREWKGQLPKSVTIHRVKKALGPRVCADLAIKTHAWDAVGIGLWHMKVIT